MEERSYTLYEFKLLPEVEQFYLVFNRGTFVDSVSNGSKTFALYAIDKFFVELVFDKATNSIKEKREFIEGKLMDKYVSFKWNEN
ncbi:hypothetical protein LZ575_19960 [Antarcticibacterium sp. 1MA-6-2]|uniref:hypothetical protein n=1 Tax=Antarcticibacterium sp. 1MA-6-2 TaxID=2908210 RepID=UPI001F365525|nr:hypothetical protein [Antarcticibacterium sp. 1MA-6-2]UJH90938.1 hypothetical protein LZ575_19960 [Antarcticibacterium sp. 1MA-6-2]